MELRVLAVGDVFAGGVVERGERVTGRDRVLTLCNSNVRAIIAAGGAVFDLRLTVHNEDYRRSAHEGGTPARGGTWCCSGRATRCPL